MAYQWKSLWNDDDEGKDDESLFGDAKKRSGPRKNKKRGWGTWTDDSTAFDDDGTSYYGSYDYTRHVRR
jgi:hypothetical protein